MLYEILPVFTFYDLISPPKNTYVPLIWNLQKDKPSIIPFCWCQHALGSNYRQRLWGCKLHYRRPPTSYLYSPSHHKRREQYEGASWREGHSFFVAGSIDFGRSAFVFTFPV